MRIEAVIFDMDGLMLDTERLYRAASQQAAEELGYTLSDTLHCKRMGCSATHADQVVIDEFGSSFPMDVFRARCQVLEATFEGTAVPKKRGLDRILDLLDSRPIPKAVATSTRRGISLPQLDATELLKRFDAIATGDEVNSGKPAPDLFLLASSRLGVDPGACLILEDSEHGVVAAHRAGMRVYWVHDLQPLSPTIERLADRLFESLDDVSRRLEETLVSSS